MNRGSLLSIVALGPVVLFLLALSAGYRFMFHAVESLVLVGFSVAPVAGCLFLRGACSTTGLIVRRWRR
jgi:hypothetical protein